MRPRAGSEAQIREIDEALALDAARGPVARAEGTGLSPVPGVAVSGAVDHAGVVVRRSGALGWEGESLRRHVVAERRAPVATDSWVNPVAASLGAPVGVRGRNLRGSAGAAGGFGEGRPCHCGARDRPETWGDRALESGTASDVITTAAAELGAATANASKVVGPERVGPTAVFTADDGLEGVG